MSGGSSLNNDERVVIDVDPESGVTANYVRTELPFYRNIILRNCINALYILFVFCIVIWPSIYGIVKTITENNFRYFSSTMFPFMYIFQYISGLMLYKEKFLSLTFNGIDDGKWKILTGYILSLVICMILASVSVVLLISGVDVGIYTELYNNANTVGKIFISIAITISKFYGYGIFFVNVTNFATILIHHSFAITAFRNKLELLINESINDITISKIIEEYTEMKNEYREVVNKLNNVFASITVFGLAGCYFTIINYGTIFVGVFSYIDICCFALVEIVYIYSINRIKNNVADIKNNVNSPRFVHKFLGKSEFNNFYGDIYDNYDDQKKPIDNKTVLTGTDKLQMEALRKTLSKAKITSPRINKNKILSDTDEISKKMSLDLKIDLIKTISYRGIIIAHENSVNLDWITLYEKLSEQWEYFQILGFEFDDISIIQKLFVIIIGFLGILKLNDQFGI